MVDYDWSKKLNELAKQGGVDLGQLARDVKIELFSAVVRYTRVDTGRLRGNWLIQEDAKAEGIIEYDDKGPEGVVTPKMKAVVNKSTEDGVTYFTNNLPYAKVYEEKDAMVGRASANVKSVLNAKIKQIRAAK